MDIQDKNTGHLEFEDNFKGLAESIPHLVWVALPNGYHEYFNQRWFDYTNTTFNDMGEKEWREIIHPDFFELAWNKWLHSLKTGEAYEVEYKLKNGKTGEYRWFLRRALPIKDSKGKIVRWFGTCTDIHEQKMTEQALTFLSQASKVLSSSLDYQTTLLSVTQLAVPEIADWCSVDLLEDGKLSLVAVAHKDPKKIDWALKIRKEMPPDLDAPSGLPKVLRTGKSEFYPVVTEEMINQSTDDEKVLSLIKQIGFSSVMIVPIIVEEKTIGAIQFVSCESKKHFTKKDLEMAEELAVRTSLAIHNAKLYEKAQTMENQFNSLYDSNIIGVIYTKTDGTLISANDAFLNSLGYTREDFESAGINLISQTPDEYRSTNLSKLSTLKKTGMLQPFEKEYFRKDGSRVPVIVGSVMLDSAVGIVMSFVLDITERKKLEQRKDEFIGIASHELRTPLTSVKGYIQILERIIQQMGDDRLKTYVKKTNTYIDRLNSLISELLDVSKIQSGKLQLNESVFEFDELMTEAIEAVQYTISSHTIIHSGTSGKKVTGDKHRLEQVITNLLTNAVKYSPRSDSIAVTTSVKDTMIEVSVRDTGIGIPKKEIPKLFNRFYRVESSAKTFSGLGIGLFISSEILQRHGGKIWVESVENKGSIFYFNLPITE